MVSMQQNYQAQLSLPGEKLCKKSGDNICNLFCQKRRHGIADLAILLGPWPFKAIIIRKGLQSSCFAHRQASALRRIIMDEIVAVFRYVRNNSGGWPIGNLHTKAIVE